MVRKDEDGEPLEACQTKGLNTNLLSSSTSSSTSSAPAPGLLSSSIGSCRAPMAQFSHQPILLQQQRPGHPRRSRILAEFVTPH